MPTFNTIPVIVRRAMPAYRIMQELKRLGVCDSTSRRGTYRDHGGNGRLRSRDAMLRTYTNEGLSGAISQMNCATANFTLASAPILATLAARVGQSATTSTPTPEAPRPVLRTLNRSGYHNGTRNYDAALARIATDADGVKRSYGLEWEIGDMSQQDEHDLAVLLDTLPAHICERDSSLYGARAVEIVFMPVGKAEYISTFNKLKTFCSRPTVSMRGAGAHTTYGVNNSTARREDIQIRLNRAALATASIGTSRAIISLFGRHFTGYASLPGAENSNTNPVLTNHHRNAFSINGRPGNSMWECRLIDWKGNPERLAEYFQLLEFVFHTPMKPVHFTKIFEFMGADTDGE